MVPLDSDQMIWEIQLHTKKNVHSKLNAGPNSEVKGRDTLGGPYQLEHQARHSALLTMALSDLQNLQLILENNEKDWMNATHQRKSSLYLINKYSIVGIRDDKHLLKEPGYGVEGSG